MSSDLNFGIRVQNNSTKSAVNASYDLKSAPFHITDYDLLERELTAAGREIFKRLIDSGALRLDTRELIDHNFVGKTTIDRRYNSAMEAAAKAPDPCDFRAYPRADRDNEGLERQ